MASESFAKSKIPLSGPLLSLQLVRNQENPLDTLKEVPSASARELSPAPGEKRRPQSLQNTLHVLTPAGILIGFICF